MSELELVHKEKNAFGDTYYHIRDSSRGVTSYVYEGDLDAFMKKHGAKELKKGSVYRYPRKRSMER